MRTSRARGVAVTLVLGAALAIGACSGGGGAPPSPAAAPPPTSGPDPSVAQYCQTVTDVQNEQTSPQAGQGGIDAASQDARRQLAALVATSPPELAGDWRTVQALTEQALGSLAATGGDPSRIDPAALANLQQQAQPAIAHIQQVTQQRCGIAFRLPG